MALVITQLDEENNCEEVREIFFLANEDKEWCAGIDEQLIEEHASEYGTCGVCKHDLVGHVKHSICPICGTEAYLT